MSAMHDLGGARFDAEGLGAVLKTALDAVVVMRVDGTIAGWNDVAARTFGWSFDEARGHRMSEMIIPHRYRAAHETGLAHYLATGEGPVLDRHFEIEALHRAGHEFPVELSISPTEQFGEPVFLGFIRDITERRDAARRQTLMVAELNHRCKNLLGVVAGLAHQTARVSPSLAEFTPAFAGRLASLGRAHEILTAATWERAPLRALAGELVAGHNGASVAGPDILLSPRQLLSLGMILHELVTNAVKYGALSVDGGRVALDWRVEEDCVKLDWIESGVTGIVPPQREGFGSKMIAMSVGHELRGTSSTEWHGIERAIEGGGGLAFRLAFPIDEDAA